MDMWTKDQIDTMAEINGRHMAERTRFKSQQENAWEEMTTRQAGEVRDAAERLGIPISGPPAAPEATPVGNMGDILGTVVQPPADVPPGHVVPVAPTPMVIPPPRAIPGGPAVPRPLHARK